MANLLSLINPLNWHYRRNSDGSIYYKVGDLNANFGNQKDKLKTALENHAIFTCIDLTAKFASKVQFYVRKGDEVTQDDDLVRRLNKPNFFQSKEDLIKEFIWFKLAEGWAVQRPIVATGFQKKPTPLATSAIYNLRGANIMFPKKFKTPMLFDKSEIEEFKKQQIKYKLKNEEKTIELAELLFFYDVANGLTDEFLLKSPSRMDAVYKSIGNLNIGLTAENVMLRTNGRELFSGGATKGSNTGMNVPMKANDRKSIERKLAVKYGMDKDQLRSIITDQGINWQSLHVALKELGFNESNAKNVTIIRSAFGVSEVMYKAYLDAGDTFENKKEGEIDFIQSAIQPHLDDLCNTYNQFYNYEKTPLIAKFDHLPVMQHVEDKKADKLLKISAAIRNLNQAGFDEAATQELIASVGITDIL